MKTLALAGLLVAGCSSSGLSITVADGGVADLAPPRDQGGFAGDLPTHELVPIAPLPPTASRHMYQGGQWAFAIAGGTCDGRVAAGMGDNAFCFAASDDSVKCAGTIGGVDFGRRFSTVPGQTGARQILISPTFNSSAGNSICILKTDGSAACMGANGNGPFADGDAQPTTTFVGWGGRSDLVALGSGTWDQMCALAAGGTLYCAGLNFGTTAVAQPGVHQSFWIDPSGMIHSDDPTVLRPGESRTECTVQATGLVCMPPMSFGPTNGGVVNGTSYGPALGPPPMGSVCWLTSDASVTCTYGPRFAPGRVLHLAASFYSDSLCAIYVDGSVWCIGSNAQGKLGTGDTTALAVETEVAPAGSAFVSCQ